MNEIEAAAKVEHEQWAHWTRYMLNNLTDENIARWRQQVDTSYEDLTEVEKESDREWAIKGLSAVFVARVGCDQCGGTGKFDPLWSTKSCPAEHVEIVNPYGGTVWADPAKVEWRCSVEHRTYLDWDGAHLDKTASATVQRACADHKTCRWLPRPLEVAE